MEEEPIYRGRLGDDDESDDDDKMEDDKEDPNIIRYRPRRQSKALP
jgi:hypothetical protein